MIPLIMLTLLFGYEYVYGAAVWDGSFCEKSTAYSDAGPDLIRDIEDKGYEIPEDIFVVDDYERSGVQRYTYVYQVKLNEYKIHAKIPEDLTQDNIVFSTISDYQELVEAGFAKARLDDNEYLYVKGDFNIEMFEAVGVKFSK